MTVTTEWTGYKNKNQYYINSNASNGGGGQGHRQRDDIDFHEVFAPTVRWTTLKLGIAMSTILGWEIYQYDIDTAFLEAKLEEDLYMRPPEGLNCAPDEVCKLQRSLYSTRQANMNFYVLIVTFLTNEGYVQSAYDPCLFYGMEVAEDPDSINIRVYVFVDDFIVTAPTTAIIFKFRSLLKSRFGVKDIGPITKVLGMHTVRDIPNGTTTLSQEAHIEQMLEKFGMTNCKGCLTPAITSPTREDNKHIPVSLEPRPKNGRQQNDAPDIPMYQSMVGSLMWVAECTRPDIKFAVGRCARKMTCPTTEDMIAVKRIMRYLSKTKKNWSLPTAKLNPHYWDMLMLTGVDTGKPGAVPRAMSFTWLEQLSLHTPPSKSQLLYPPARQNTMPYRPAAKRLSSCEPCWMREDSHKGTPPSSGRTTRAALQWQTINL